MRKSMRVVIALDLQLQPLLCSALTRNLADANGLKNIIQPLNFGIADADGKLMVFVTVFPAQGDSSFSVDQAGNIGGIGRR